MTQTSRMMILLLLGVSFFMPFLLITDLYPMFRFGMFAEKPRYEAQSEIFELIWQSKKQPKDSLLILPEMVNNDQNTLQHLIRKYVYERKTVYFLQHFWKIFQKKQPHFQKKQGILYLRNKTSKKIYLIDSLYTPN